MLAWGMDVSEWSAPAAVAAVLWKLMRLHLGSHHPSVQHPSMHYFTQQMHSENLLCVEHLS